MLEVRLAMVCQRAMDGLALQGFQRVNVEAAGFSFQRVTGCLALDAGRLARTFDDDTVAGQGKGGGQELWCIVVVADQWAKDAHFLFD